MLADGVVAAGLLVPGSDGSTREAPAGMLEGSEGFEVASGEEYAGAAVLTGGGSGWKFDAHTGRDRR